MTSPLIVFHVFHNSKGWPLQERYYPETYAGRRVLWGGSWRSLP